MEVVDLNVKLDRLEWLKLNFLMGYTNAFVLFITAVGIINTIIIIDYLTANSFEIDEFPFFGLIMGILTLIFIPLATYIQAIKQLKTNIWINQKIHYSFDPNAFHVDGETFNLNMSWSDVQSIKEVKGWYAILTEGQRGFFIPKDRFKDIHQEKKFRLILDGIKNTKVKLKK